MTRQQLKKYWILFWSMYGVCLSSMVLAFLFIALKYFVLAITFGVIAFIFGLLVALCNLKIQNSLLEELEVYRKFNNSK